jgi:hypothetical protein
MDFLFALVVMVSAILASPSDRVRGREKERKRKGEIFVVLII